MSFVISRPDGRSNQQVVIDEVADKAPGTIFTFDELASVLGTGVEREFDRTTITAVVCQANRRLLREHARRLFNVRGKGYKLSHGNEHIVLASGDSRRAAKQQAKALLTLQNARWDEMDPTVREVTLAHLTLTASVIANQQALEGRMARVEDAIRKIVPD